MKKFGFTIPKIYFVTSNGCDEVGYIFAVANPNFFRASRHFFSPHQIQTAFSATANCLLELLLTLHVTNLIQFIILHCIQRSYFTSKV